MTVKFKVVGCSSASDVHVAENLTCAETYRFWSTAAPERKAYVDLDLLEPTKIASLRVVNAGSAFVEVLVGSKDTAAADYQVLLPITSLMTLHDVRDGTNKSRSVVFGTDKLSKYVLLVCLPYFSRTVAAKKWQTVRIVVTQPFLQPTYIGLACVEVHADTPHAHGGAGAGVAFVIPSIDDDDTPRSKSIPNLFAQRQRTVTNAFAMQTQTSATTSAPTPQPISNPVSQTLPSSQQPVPTPKPITKPKSSISPSGTHGHLKPHQSTSPSTQQPPSQSNHTQAPTSSPSQATKYSPSQRKTALVCSSDR